MPERINDAVPIASLREEFFALNGSIEGVMMCTASCRHQAGTYALREKTNASAFWIIGLRKSQARSVSSFEVSRPTWQRHTTRAPAARRRSTMPAVCGSCSKTMSPTETRARHLLDVGFEGLGHHGALGLTQMSTVACLAVQHVVHTLGDGEELWVAGEDEPAGLDVDRAHVGEQGLQHLGYARRPVRWH